ncbi:kynureninase/PvdN C-terminal domain-containing protein [Actinophytocola gossypii]|uniref:Kynureninase n=1 Tax=Actinophytocola gossypii TaxID=2812003 RepID=A0ABT2JI91_9PSEU|nr:kynureninase [Actinophytocola gossypii]MCT2587594.1 kynureninase [Actinophytocola gossypii]
MTTLDSLRASPNALAEHYARFRVADRLLLTGHSHQAWPDLALAGQVDAVTDAAEAVDRKWELAFAKADRLRAGYRALLDDPDADIALAPSTHDLVVRFLSALDLRRRPRLVTSDGEFHTLRRQLARLAEEGVEVVRVAASPADTLAERLAAQVDDRTAAVLVSSVLFGTSRIVPNLRVLADACARVGAELLVDAYHALGVVPTSVRDQGLTSAWITGGGYKYLQLGEGNCFLRLPPHAATLRPVVTGWFAEFEDLAAEASGLVGYAPGGDRFAGSTYDPTSHYRAARVLDFFAEQGLTPAFLREVSLHQTTLLADRFDALDAPPDVITRDRSAPRTSYGGFLALRSPVAGELQRKLAERGVLTDSRGEYLRFGPAPYLSDQQLDQAIATLGSLL